MAKEPNFKLLGINSVYDMYCIIRCFCQNYSGNHFWVAQLVKVADSAMQGGVVEVVSSNLARGYKYFSTFTGIADLLLRFREYTSNKRNTTVTLDPNGIRK